MFLKKHNNVGRMCSLNLSDALKAASHLHSCATWQGWPWQAWVEQRRLVIGVLSAVRHSAPVRHCDPSCHCCCAPGHVSCRFLYLRLLLHRHFGHHGHCGAHSHPPHRCPLPRAQTSSPCPLSGKQGSALSFSDEWSLKRWNQMLETVDMFVLTSKVRSLWASQLTIFAFLPLFRSCCTA